MGRRRKKGKSRGGGADGEPHKSSRSDADSATAGGDQKVLSGDEAEQERGSDGEPHPWAGSSGGVEQESRNLGLQLQDAEGQTERERSSGGASDGVPHPRRPGSNAGTEEETLDLGLQLQHGERETEQQRGSRGGSDGVPHPRAGSNAGTEQERLDLGLQLQHGEGQATASSSIGGLGVPMPGGAGGGGTGRAAATSQRVATGVVEPAGKATPSGSPSRSFLSEVVLSWTVRDILDEHLYRAEVQKIPTIFNSIDQFAEVHCPLLLEELRWILSSAIQNPEHTQFCEVLSVEKCGSDCLFLDIDLDACNPDNFLCRHIAHDYDVCLLTSDPLGDSNLDPFSSSLGIVMNVGYDTFFQRGFIVKVAKHEELKSENCKYVSFLTNIEHRMEIYNICSIRDDKSRTAVKGVMELYEKANNLCSICDASPCDLFSSMRCPHQENVKIVWAPPGSMEGRIADHMEEFVGSKQKVLICLPNAASIPTTITELKKFSNSVVVLNNSEGLENYISSNEVFLDGRSHELYCFVTQYQGSMKAMSSLLNLNSFYHYDRCSTSASCARCMNRGLLNFSMKLFVRKFNDLIGYTLDCLTFLEKHVGSFSLLEDDSTKIRDLLKTLKEFKSLLCNGKLQEKHVAAAFELMPRVDVSSVDSTYTLAEALNRKRISSINLMGSLIHSVQVPKMKNRDDLNRFCIKHSSIIVTTVDCTLKLHDMERQQFHILMILGANQIIEADLLLPFIHAVKNVILIGDPYHIQPAVQSELCKEAGFGDSIFNKMQRLIPKKVEMLKQQFVLHPQINKFPNNYFYDGEIRDDLKVLSPEYNKEFSTKLPTYCFMNIPFGEMKSTVNSTVIFALLLSFCKDIMESNRKFNVAVVCLTNDEVNTMTDLLRSKKDIHAKIHLHVKTVSSFQDECYDLVILSLITEEKSDLCCIEINNLYAVLTSSRHYFWIVGEYNTLIDTRGICQSLVLDAEQRECVQVMQTEKYSQAVKIFGKINMDRYSSNKFTNPLGQELTWDGRPYKGKYMLPPVRDQKGQPDTCTFHSISGAVESLFKFFYANLVPQQDFKWIFNVDDFKQKYERTIVGDFQSEAPSERGDKRLKNALEAFKNLGVVAKNESTSEVREFKISCHEHIDPKNTDEVTKLLKDGNIMVGRIFLSRNFYSLKPGQVYVHDEKTQLYHPTSGLAASHALMMMGIGRRLQTELDKKTGERTYTRRHMVSQNSEGELCGINGIIRVEKKSVSSMHRIQVLDTEAAGKPMLRA